MKVLPCKTLLSVLLLPALVSGQSRAHSGEATPAVEIVLYNHAEVPSDVIEQAGMHADEVFNRAGVELAWTKCLGTEVSPDACKNQPGPNQIVVRLLRRPTDRKVEFAPNTGGVAMRATREGGRGYITIYYGQVEEIAERLEIRRKCVLGHALAHEIGHLLLPNGSHSQTGIMREQLGPEDWRAAARGRLWFTKQQAEAMRAGFVAREATQPAPASETHVLPLERLDGRGLLLVQVTVNGKPGRLVVDTGAGLTTISYRLAGVAGKDFERETKAVRAATGTHTWVTLPGRLTLALGSLAERRVVQLADFEEVSRLTGTRVDGVLGTDVLAEFSQMTIDFRARTLTLRKLPADARAKAGKTNQ